MKEDKKLVIVVVAGQSNATGYDESPLQEDASYNLNSRAYQLGYYAENNLKLIPLTHRPEDLQDMSWHKHPNSREWGTKSVHLPLANLLVPTLPEEYDLVMLPVSFGGTSFTRGLGFGEYDAERLHPVDFEKRDWGLETPYYQTMKDRLQYLLDMNEENILLGVIWIQGENDSEDSERHWEGFTAMTEDFIDYFASKGYGSRTQKGRFDRDIWFNVESTRYWKTLSWYNEILANYKVWNPRTYVEVPDEALTNEINGTGLTTGNLATHYGNNAYYTHVAPAIFKQMQLNNVLLT